MGAFLSQFVREISFCERTFQARNNRYSTGAKILLLKHRRYVEFNDISEIKKKRVNVRTNSHEISACRKQNREKYPFRERRNFRYRDEKFIKLENDSNSQIRVVESELLP